MFRVHRGLPGLGPGSLRMALTALSNPLRHPPLQLVAGWLPAGVISTDSLKDVVGRAVPGRWVDHPNYWAVTCDYESGQARALRPRWTRRAAEIADAVAASCAIPGFYRPVRIGGRRYVDGGVCSASNLDLLAGRGLDLVICLNPLSSSADPRSVNPLDWPSQLSRAANAQAARPRGAQGAPLRHARCSLIEPTAADLRGDGPQPDEPGPARPGDRDGGARR